MARGCRADERMILDSPSARANNPAMSAFLGIEAFVRVVETGSVTAAAERMQTAKSSVSDQVRALEERMGVRLLDRGPRSVRPTEAGMAFYRRCVRMLEEAEAGRLEAVAMRDAPTGRLRVAAPEGFSARFIMPSLTGFFAAHPAVEVEVVEDTRFVKLTEESFDLAIRVTGAPTQGQVVRRLATQRVILVASPGYLVQHAAPQKPADLPRHRCIGFGPLVWRDTWTVGGETVTVRPALISHDTETLRWAALAGIGIAPVPDWLVADALATGALVRVLDGFAAPEWGIFAVYPTNRMLTPAVRVFVDHLAAGLRARGHPARRRCRRRSLPA